VRRGSFRPPPKVDGAFVGFTLAPPPLSDAQMEAFVPWLRELFTRRRKTVKNALGAMAGEERARAALAAGLIDPRCRAETLTPEELLALYQGWRSAGAGGEGR
jgi:16S rRNA (adenine1518-N6/adenine1519-N6)-dimethyltransferase